MNITRILIESESDVNGFFTVFFEDGPKQSGWSCDQGGIEWDDENFRDENVDKLCFDLWFQMDFSLDDGENRLYAEWDQINGLGETKIEAA